MSSRSSSSSSSSGSTTSFSGVTTGLRQMAINVLEPIREEEEHEEEVGQPARSQSAEQPPNGRPLLDYSERTAIAKTIQPPPPPSPPLPWWTHALVQDTGVDPLPPMDICRPALQTLEELPRPNRPDMQSASNHQTSSRPTNTNQTSNIQSQRNVSTLPIRNQRPQTRLHRSRVPYQGERQQDMVADLSDRDSERGSAGASQLPQSRINTSSQPKRRPRERMNKQKEIRDFFDVLLGDNPQEHCPTTVELTAFAATWNPHEPELNPCCTPEDFRIDVIGGPHSPWNQSAVTVFVTAFAEYQGYVLTPDLAKEISSFAFTRIKTLKFSWSRDRLAPNLRRKHAQADRRWTRKVLVSHCINWHPASISYAQLYRRRRRAAEEHPLLRPHLGLLDELGPTGMSSDESDYEDLPYDASARRRAPRYRVLHPKWRNQKLHAWLEVFSSVDFIMRRTNPSAARGAYPRLRENNPLDPRFSEKTSYPRDLYRSCYDPAWLAAHSGPFGVQLPEDDYELNHHPDLFRYIHDEQVRSGPSQARRM
ncbi:hypothetical protein CC2G_008283 [Coprinopsis cinerea AmutBmut pab1-1]|nr:hypothetical protein CC2G_008283 [Coprinopsis cinerea AmutBmut pab1-1]